MTEHSTRNEPRPARRLGYLVAVIVNVILLGIVNVRPGWREMPSLTADFVSVLFLVNLSLVAGIAVNLVYVAYDPAWFKSVGQLVVLTVGLAAAARLLQVFPFDFSESSVNWEPLVRILLWLAIVGSFVAIVVELARLANRGVSAGLRSQSLHHPGR